MKKILISLSMALVLILGAVTPGLATAVMAVSASGDGTPVEAIDGEMPEMIAFRPAPMNMTPELVTEYPYMGLTLTLPEALRNSILGNEVFMQIDGDVSSGVSEDGMVSYDWAPESGNMFVNTGFIDFLYMPEDTRDGMPSMEQANFMDYDAFELWRETLVPLARISMIHQDKLAEQDVAALTGFADNTELGTYGEYVYYFSMGDAAGSEDEVAALLAQCEAMRDSLVIAEPKPIDGKFMGLSTPFIEEVSSIASFAATDLDGQPITEEIFSKAKLTMLNVWTTWCSPCIQEMPDLGEIGRELADQGVQLVGVVFDAVNEGTGEPDAERIELAKTIVEKTGADYQMIVPDEALNEGVLGNILGFPTTYFIDSEGNVVGESVLGSRTKAEWLDVIQEMLALAEAGA